MFVEMILKVSCYPFRLYCLLCIRFIDIMRDYYFFVICSPISTFVLGIQRTRR